MRSTLPIIAALLALTACTPQGKAVFVQAETVQLSRPVVRVDQHFFEQETTLHPGPPQEGTVVRYAMGEDSLHAGSPVADQPITVDESSTLRFQRRAVLPVRPGDRHHPLLPRRPGQLDFCPLRPQGHLLRRSG